MLGSIQRRTRSTSSSDQGASQGIVPSASRDWISSAFSRTSSEDDRSNAKQHRFDVLRPEQREDVSVEAQIAH
jgi:hypothetical protein